MSNIKISTYLCITLNYCDIEFSVPLLYLLEISVLFSFYRSGSKIKRGVEFRRPLRNLLKTRFPLPCYTATKT